MIDAHLARCVPRYPAQYLLYGRGMFGRDNRMSFAHDGPLAREVIARLDTQMGRRVCTNGAMETILQAVYQTVFTINQWITTKRPNSQYDHNYM